MSNLSTIDGFVRPTPAGYDQDPLLNTDYEVHEIHNFETAMLSAIGGTANPTIGTGSADRPAWSFAPDSNVAEAFNYQALLGARMNMSVGTSRILIAWGKRKVLSVRFITNIAQLTSIIRFYWGPLASTWVGQDLAVKGIGFEITNGAIKAVCNNGSIKTTASVGFVLTNLFTTNIVIDSDGLGNVRWWVNGIEQVPLTGGPTTNSSVSQFGICAYIQSSNPAGTVQLTTERITLYSKN